MTEQKPGHIFWEDESSIYRCRILYMEDDLELGLLLKKRLERVACVVELARDGQEGLKLCESNQYDMVISDYDMPLVSGLEVLRRLKDSLPVIILTGQGDEMVAVEAMKLGAADYITKDGNGKYLELLPSVIDRVLERRQLINERCQALAELQASEERYRAIVEDQTEMICRFEPGGKLTFANAAFCRNFGIPQADIAFLNMAAILSRKSFHYIKGVLRVLDPQRPTVMKTHEIKLLDGRTQWIQWTGRAIFVDAGSPKEFQLVGRDISENKGIEAALRASEAKNSALINAIPDPIFRVNLRGVFIDIWCKPGQVIYIPQELVGQNIKEFFSPDAAALMLEHIGKTLVEGNIQVFQFECKMGEYVSYQEARVIFAGIEEALVILRDITEQVKMEQHLQHLSIHDSLTGLYNRTYFAEEMRRLGSGRYGSVGIVVCDVDGLKIVNDTLGHAAGDQLLKAAAKVILQAFRGNDAIARIGGDEFVILLPNVTQAVLDAACKRLKLAIAEYNQTEPGLAISLSIGAAVSSRDNPNLEDVFKQADQAMYKDKLSKRRPVREAKTV